MPEDPAAEKRRLRGILSERRRGVPTAEAERAARRIAALLLAEPRVRGARRIALYAALAGEVPTRPLFDALAALRVPRLFPRMAGERGLAFAAVAGWGELSRGRYGVLEPPAQAAAVRPEQGDLVLVPGVAFDRAGHRLGRGQGCYDRAFPPSAPHPPTLIGVAFSLQVIEAVPHVASDRRMDALVSELGLHWVEGGRG